MTAIDKPLAELQTNDKLKQTATEQKPETINVAKKLIEYLQWGGTYSYYWTKDKYGKKRTYWYETGKLCKPPNDEGLNVYFGVYPTTEIPKTNSRGEPRLPENVRGRIEFIAAINCLFGEFDAKDFDDSKENALDHIEFLDVPPSVIVDSGGGYHCYWLLKDTLVLNTLEERNEINDLQHLWVDFVGSDPDAKDLARVLRIPGSKNCKPEYDPPREVKFVKTNFDLLYTIDDLRAALPKDEPKKRKVNSRVVRDFSIEDMKVLLPLISISTWCEYETWLQLGMALHHFGDPGLELWIEYSKQSSNFQDEVCEEKFDSFGDEKGITPATVFYYAKRDNPEQYAKLAKDHWWNKRIFSEEYILVLRDLGYEFRELELDASIEVNGERLEDGMEAVVRTQLRNRGYDSVNVARDAYIAYAHEHKYHPVRDYLEGFDWDGKDHIGKLSGYFKDVDNTFPLWLKRWLIGSVARVYKPGSQSRMLCLDGAQGLGKSHFVNKFLCSHITKYGVESSISPEDKDHRIMLTNKWIWEAQELGSTFRRADVEALKGFLSQTYVTVRHPYGHYDLQRPAIANFIGTINNEHGFLNDPTGNRRFMVSTITNIDWNYCTDVDVDQVWAQAKALYEAGEPWELAGEEKELANKFNAKYEIRRSTDDYLDTIIKEYDGNVPNYCVTSLDILQAVKNLGAKGSDDLLSKDIATYMRRNHNLEAKLVRVSFTSSIGEKESKPVRGYSGIDLIKYDGNTPDHNFREAPKAVEPASSSDEKWDDAEETWN